MPKERHQNGWVELVGKRVKKWKGHFWIYKTVEGAEKRCHTSRIVGLKSKMPKWKAEEELRAIIERETKQLARCDGTATLGWFWEHRYLPSRTWDAATKSAVGSVVRRHVLPQFGDVPLSDLDKFAMQSHLNALAEGYSQSLVKKVRVQLAAVLEEAVEQEIIGKNPARKLQMPKTRKPCGRFLTVEEYWRLLAELEDRDRLVVHIAVALGLRPGELFALRWDDVEPGRLRVDESLRFGADGTKDPKTEGSNAFVYLTPGLQGEIERWRISCGAAAGSSVYIFPARTGAPISPHNYERDVIVPAATSAGIMPKPPKDRPKGAPKCGKATAVNFQAFRRTTATWMQRGGGTIKDVQGAMRHASPEVTLRSYMKEIPAGVQAVVESLDAMLTPQHGGGRVQ
ncbi:MAG TPA: tyrosine-type recombinase/integrase [Bryobacteraceae bacterium]|nr:tyrosine-type recombinase/integrase [Bryobacteraceae bacterium]